MHIARIVRVGKSWAVCIPKTAWQKLGCLPRSYVIVRLVDGAIVLEKLDINPSTLERLKKEVSPDGGPVQGSCEGR